MACRGGSLSRSLLSAVRSTTLPSSSYNSFSQSAQLSFLGLRLPSGRLLSTVLSRNAGVLGCTQSLLPLAGVVAAFRLTSLITMDSRSWCEMSQGTYFSRTCPDR